MLAVGDDLHLDDGLAVRSGVRSSASQHRRDGRPCQRVEHVLILGLAIREAAQEQFVSIAAGTPSFQLIPR